ASALLRQVGDAMRSAKLPPEDTEALSARIEAMRAPVNEAGFAQKLVLLHLLLNKHLETPKQIEFEAAELLQAASPQHQPILASIMTGALQARISAAQARLDDAADALSRATALTDSNVNAALVVMNM